MDVVLCIPSFSLVSFVSYRTMDMFYEHALAGKSISKRNQGPNQQHLLDTLAQTLDTAIFERSTSGNLQCFNFSTAVSRSVDTYSKKYSLLL